MNLVAKEFVACQRDEPGVLLLSEFAGAASEMGEAIRINPYDESGTAEALARALAMPMDERAERHAALNARIRRNDAVAWADQSVDDLVSATEDRAQTASRLPEPPIARVVAAFRAAQSRMIAVDYDGTLVPLAARPADAVPSPAVAEVLTALARRKATELVVVSGRTAADLERWFGRLDGIWLAAEHGAVLREPGGEWSLLHPGTDLEWMPRIREVLEHYLARVPGSAIEAKEYSLAWHYRLVEPEFGEWIANEVATTLDEQVAGTELAVLRGSKVIEVRFAWANKGEVVGSLRSRLGPDAFELAIGDDRTDEDMFERLGPDAWTIRVGQGTTTAGYRVAGPRAVLSLLSALGTDAD
jgi:trehalose 6-phosphate synthase/phosphatase